MFRALFLTGVFFLVEQVSVLGPAVSVFGQAVTMSQITNTKRAACNFHFVTLSEGTIGEYCLWRLRKNEDGEYCYEMCPRLLNPEVTDIQWLCGHDSPKTTILRAVFSESNKLMMVVKREKYGKSSDNGIGIQTSEVSETGCNFGPWYQVTDSLDGDDIVCCRWMHPLLLGRECCASIFVRKKGLFEMVQHRYGSPFQGSNDNFKCVNYVQVGRYHRYWVNTEGELRAIVVTPQVNSSHPEWSDVCKRDNQNHDMRVLGKRIGYQIQDIQKDSNVTLLSLYNNAKKAVKANKKQSSSKSNAASSHESSVNVREIIAGKCDVLSGFHLHRCKKCKAVLMKPLLCGRCKKVCYCSRTCQASDWEEGHSSSCFINT